jgi:hypothetical protein
VLDRTYICLNSRGLSRRVFRARLIINPMALELDTATLQAALVGYQQQLEEIEAKMRELRRRLGKSVGVRPAAAVNRVAPRKHRMSAEGRARIAAAQRARWAKAKKAKKAGGEE